MCDVFEYWREKFHPSAELNEKRRSIIYKRLSDGFTAQELKLAIDGCSQSSFNRGDNDRGKTYDDITHIFKTGDHVQHFVSIASPEYYELKSNV